MVKTAEKLVFIQEFNGERVPFDPVELQTHLINCFLAAGMRDSSYMAEDIALAVEYTLLNSPRPEPVFGRGELGSAVVRMLEETGFPEVGAIFRRNGGESFVSVSTRPDAVGDLLRKFLACPVERFELVTQLVCNALKTLGISETSPHLVLELARHYERQGSTAAVEPETPSAEKWEATATQADLVAMLPPEARQLADAGVIRINAISPLFPCLRIFFMIGKFAKQLKLQPPVTEMEIIPGLYQAGHMLELCRVTIINNLTPGKPYPFYLSIPDMSDFVVNYLGGERMKSSRIGRELAKNLTAELGCEVYKLTLS